MVNILLKHPEWELFVNEKSAGRLNFAESKVITMLASAGGDILDKHQLLDNGWPSKIVSPNSLNVAIKNIRGCLDSVDCQDVIITHPKRGFSWNAAYHLEHEYPQEEQAWGRGTLLPLNASKPTHHSPSLKQIALLTLNGMVVIYIIAVSLFYLIYKVELQCQTIDDMSFCGVGKLRQDKITNAALSGQKYVYGYRFPDKAFIYDKLE